MPFKSDGSYEFIFGRSYCIPSHMVQSLYYYLHAGREPGEFLYLILTNDFVHAAAYADEHNMACLPAYACFLYNEMPQGAWGSKAVVDQWMKLSHPECDSYGVWLQRKLKEQ